MKQFACGDVIPGCETTFTGASTIDILRQVVAHAVEVHGTDDVKEALVNAVTSDDR